MQSSRYKLIYSNWIDLPAGSVPIANGMHPKVIDWMKSYAAAHSDIKPDNNYGRIYELETEYQRPNSGIVFHHINFFYYFKKHYGIENVISEDQIDVDSDYVYFLPYELEGSNINYFYDNFSFTVNDEKLIYKFPETLSPTMLGHLRSGRVKLLLANVTEFSYGKDTLNKLEFEFRTMGINGSNVNYLLGNTILDYTGKIVQVTSHASLQQQAEIGYRYPIQYGSLGYLSDYPKVDELDSSKIRPMKFISWNRTMNRSHRLGIAHLALKYNLLENNIFSFLNIIDSQPLADHFRDIVDYPIQEVEKIIEDIRAIVPHQVDTQTLNRRGRESFQTNENNKKEYYTDTYLHLTSETLFDANSSPFMSEKTFRPMLNLQPFIYFGNYKGLAELHRLGFKTFDGYIDESYDNERDPKKRFALIEKELKRFVDMSMQEIHDWYYSLTDILIYNQQHFLTFKDYDPLKDLFDRY